MKNRLILLILLMSVATFLYSQGYWTQKQNVGTLNRCSGIGMATTTKGYISCGYLGGYDTFKDMWEYDPSVDTWTQKTDFPGAKRRWLIGFVIGEKCYVGLGAYMISAGNYTYYTDFYEFDPATNTWTAKASFPGTPRASSFCFSIKDKGYVGGGSGASGVMSDLWEYNPTTNTWTQKNNIGCGSKYAAATFVIGDYAYVGTGVNNSGTYLNDFWQYSPESDTWTQKSSFPGTERWYATGFSISNKGFIGSGALGTSSFYKDFWQYDPTTDTWTSVTNLSGSVRMLASSFTINNKGYVGTGWTSSTTYTSDFWEYTPSWYGISEETPIDFSWNLYPNPAIENISISLKNPINNPLSISIYDISGKTIFSSKMESGSLIQTISLNNLNSGKYFVELKNNEYNITKSFIKL